MVPTCSSSRVSVSCGEKMTRYDTLPALLFSSRVSFSYGEKDLQGEMVPTCTSFRVSVSCGEKVTRFDKLPTFFPPPGFLFLMERKIP
jgi:hypothetical protein